MRILILYAIITGAVCPIIALKANRKHPEKKTYVGTIQYPLNTSKVPMRIYYNGQAMKTDDGAFTITEEEAKNAFTILFVKTLKHPHKNTITTLTLPKGSLYKWYQLSIGACQTHDATTRNFVQWIIHEQKGIATDDQHIPENTFIVFLDPTHIQTLKTASWRPDQSIINLPTVVLDTQLSDTTLQIASIRSSIESLDFDPFHERATTQACKLASCPPRSRITLPQTA